MIDQWFKKDLQGISERHPVTVVSDPTGEAEFLLNTVESAYTVCRAEDEIGELRAKYQIEKAQPTSERFLVYTRIPREGLRFLREYCEIYGCVEIAHIANYVRDKVHRTLNLHINLPKEELLTAAKISVGKDRTYWMDLCHKGAGEIFDLEKELLPFLHDPEGFASNRFDAQIREAFYRKVCELLGQPYVSKPGGTLASEVVRALLDGLAKGSCPKVLEAVYGDWLDSVSYRDSFDRYLSTYSMPTKVDLWKVRENHPFRTVDDNWLQALGEALGDAAAIAKLLPKVRKRSNNKQARAVGVTFWDDVLTLLDFDPKDIAYLGSFDECVVYYTKHFCPLDTAIRRLYTEFLNQKPLLEPWQALYREHVTVFLDRWFKHFDGYQENQTGLLQRLIKDSSVKTAIIVGDGVAYEMARQIAQRTGSRHSYTEKMILADLPSETENNMSRIYLDNGLVEKVQGNREKYLREHNAGKTLDFLRLDEVTDEPLEGQFLICTYKEIDEMGEKLQQKALKYFGETIDFFGRKITQLLDSGYRKVYLISDHGFVLTGILSEADKITATVPDTSHKAERYIRSHERLPGLEKMIEVERPQGRYKYLYLARNLNSFKTPGVYGFAHGGATPQEIVTPLFCWERVNGAGAALPVKLANKDAMQGVTGELFGLRVEAENGSGELFARERRVYLAFFSKQVSTNKSDVFTVTANGAVQKDYPFDGHAEIEAQLLDAETKELLDKAVITQTKARDMGGLL
jgi:hypothetical protein